MVTSASIMPRPPRLNSTVLTTSVELLKGDDGKPLSREALLQRAFGNRYTVQEIGATAELMTHFYRGMIERGETASRALWGAQRALAHDRRFAAPFYWAGFTLQGDWR